MNPKQKKVVIDQNLKVGLLAGQKNNVFIFNAPQANVNASDANGFDGPMQMLYAVASEMLEQGVSYDDWKSIARRMMLRVAVDKCHGNKLEASRLLNIQRQAFYLNELELLE